MNNKPPKNWKRVTLGELLDYERPDKYIVSSEDYSDSYKTPVLTAGKTFILGYTNDTEGIYKNLPVIIFDDFTTESKYVDFDFKVKSSAMKMLKAENNITLKYLYYLMQTLSFNHDTHKRYWISEYSKLKIDIPDKIEEQQEIVQVLDTMSDIIRWREECITHAQDLIPALFQEMFKPYVNYTKKTLNNLFEFKSGGTPSRLVKEYFQGDIPWITTVALNKLYINKDDANELITEEAIQNSSTKLIPANSLLFGTRVGIGKLAINTVPMCTNQDIVAMIPLKNNNLNLIYVYWYLKQINNFFVANGRGVTIQGITTHLVRSTEIILPPLKIQEQFAAKVEEINSYIKEQQEELENAKQMFQALLHHAFTGDLTRKKYGGST